MPFWLAPMAATLTQDRPQKAQNSQNDRDEWLFERKFDGIRLLAYKRGKDVKLYSRNRLLQNIPGIESAIAAMRVDEVILDGEVTWDRHSGYHVFDILWLDGQSTTALPLEERRALLAKLTFKAPLQRVETLDDPEPWEQARRQGWEGVIAKRRGSPYEHRRSKHWLKMKIEASQELVVGGFTDPQGARVGLGALLVGYYEPSTFRRAQGRPEQSRGATGSCSSRPFDRLKVAPCAVEGRAESRGDRDDFVFAGKIGTGFDTNLLLDLRRRLDALEIPKTPFTVAKGLPRLRAHWVRPSIVVQVSFIEWTANNKLRHPRLIGVRFDKAAREIVRESFDSRSPAQEEP